MKRTQSILILSLSSILFFTSCQTTKPTVSGNSVNTSSGSGNHFSKNENFDPEVFFAVAIPGNTTVVGHKAKRKAEREIAQALATIGKEAAKQIADVLASNEFIKGGQQV